MIVAAPATQFGPRPIDIGLASSSFPLLRHDTRVRDCCLSAPPEVQLLWSTVAVGLRTSLQTVVFSYLLHFMLEEKSPIRPVPSSGLQDLKRSSASVSAYVTLAFSPCSYPCKTTVLVLVLLSWIDSASSSSQRLTSYNTRKLRFQPFRNSTALGNTNIIATGNL